VEATVQDFDFDARQEIRLSNDRLIGYLAPSRGGHLYELDVRSIEHNLAAGMNRRSEPYHDRLSVAPVSPAPSSAAEQCQGAEQRSEAECVEHQDYDAWPRRNFVDHFLCPGLSLGEFRAGRGHVGDFSNAVYESRIRESAAWVELCMQSCGRVGAQDLRVKKTVRLESGSGCLFARYEIDGLAEGERVCFAVEFNLSGLTTTSEDAYYYDPMGRQLGSLESVQTLTLADRIGVADEVIGMDVAIDATQRATVWAFPIQTVTQSQRGVEVLSQSCCLVPHWQVVADANGRWQVTLKLSIDTAAAQARQLSTVASERVS
jgi:alpha-amylase